jgi:hypothetical protein
MQCCFQLTNVLHRRFPGLHTTAQAGLSRHTRQPNWWSVHQRRLVASCCPPFRQPLTRYKACIYGWQRQASSFKSSNRLPWPAMSPDLNPIEHIMLLPTDECFAQEVSESVCDGLTCLKYALWDSNPGSWLAKEQKSRLRLLLLGWDAGLRPSSKYVGFTPGTELWTIDVVKWFISDVLKVKWQSYRAFWTVKVNT